MKGGEEVEREVSGLAGIIVGRVRGAVAFGLEEEEVRREEVKREI